VKCPSCETENIDGAKFCKKCGQSLRTELICPNCNHPNSLDSGFCIECGHSLTETTPEPTQPIEPTKPSQTEPISFVDNRYQVIKKLGEGGKKKVYLVHDTRLDRDVAFALIKTENLDEDGRKRITREAQAIGKLGDNPNIVSIFEMGELSGQPYIVQPYMPSDIEKLIEKAPDHKLPLDQVINLAKDVCRGLEFAHSKGIIHRDIKPGNVLVNDEGKARITDFGLVMVTNVSRLTQEGLMVGTPNYMSPEQAYSGEVTTKADLYSFGAMLYEMVTGRPPFVGDDYVAVVTQHINTQPISPTWHRADLPPALESLILLLLEKNAEKRPASAKDVLAALESIEKGDIKESTIEQQIPTENPIYRRIFVGRENELRQLQNTFNGAMSGQGALTMVVGEPGIGKTALCEQLSTYVTLRGGMTLWGHCYEEGSLSLPYLAFIEAMRSYVLDREPDELKKELGSGATDVARIVSEIREKLHVEPRDSQNPEEDRYRLMQAVTSFLKNASMVKPMLVILEDLHDADKGTLEMLSYVSRNLSSTRLLLIGTYRDVEVDRNHPLSAALAELRRVSSFGRVLLRGLNIDEVKRMLGSLTQENIPVGLAEAVHRQTEGNPLFVQEVVRYLTEEKLLTRESGRLQTSSDTALEMSIPEGLRDVIGKRLSNLSIECNKVLSIAAVIGREFRLDVFEKVAGITEDEIYKALEEAKGAAIVEERSALGATITYRFTHAFFRQTLYEEIIAPRRIRLHQQVAQTLETVYAHRLTEHAAELAEHFSYSPDLNDLGKAVKYGEMAAQRAVDVYDYGEAARLRQQAARVQEVLDPEDKEKICDMLLTLGKTYSLSGEHQHPLDVEVPTALSIAESLGDNQRISQAYLLAIESLFWEGYGETISSQEAMELIEKADHYALPNSPERSWVDYWLGYAKCVRGENQSGIPLLEKAVSQAKVTRDIDLMGHAILQWVAFGLTPWSADKAQEIISDDIVKNIDEWYFSFWYCSISCGKRQGLEEAIFKAKERAINTNFVQRLSLATTLEAALYFIDGKLELTIETLEDMLISLQETDYEQGVAQHSMWTGLRPILYLGYERYTDSILWKAIQEILKTITHVRPPLFQAYTGMYDEVNAELDSMLETRPTITTAEDLTPAWQDVAYLEAALLAKHSKAIEKLFNRLKEHTLSVATFFWTTCIALHVGSAAVFLSKYDEAREHFEEAIKVCTEMPFRPELALSRLGLAELLLDHYSEEKVEAVKHLDLAIKEFREMKMQPSLERALRRKDILKA